MLSSIQKNTLSVYYQSLDNINFDESVDTIPSSSNQEQREEKRTNVVVAGSGESDDVVMQAVDLTYDPKDIKSAKSDNLNQVSDPTFGKADKGQMLQRMKSNNEY